MPGDFAANVEPQGRRSLRVGLSGLSGCAVMAAVFAVAALVSIVLTQASGSVAILWLPNGLALALLVARPDLARGAVIGCLVVGVWGTNQVGGHGLVAAAGLALANGVAVLIASGLYARLLVRGIPHDDLRSYLTFLFLVSAPSALVGSLLGTGVLWWTYAYPPAATAYGWFIGDLTSMMTVVPVALVLLRPERLPGASADRRELSAALLIVAAIAAAILLAALLLDISHLAYVYLLLAPMLSIIALRMSVVSIQTVTLGLLLTLNLFLFADRDSVAQDQMLAAILRDVVFLFFCASLPANLIAIIGHGLRRSQEQAGEVNRLKSEFLSKMSHELRTPLNAIHGMFELIQMSELGEKPDRWSATGLTACDQLQELMDQVLDMASLQSKCFSIALSPTNPLGLAREWRLMTLARSVQLGKPITVSLETGGDLPETLLLDSGKLNQIVANLVDNALKFSDAGTLTLSIDHIAGTAVPPQLRVRVSDEGPGIPPEHLEQIFDRFHQVENDAARCHSGAGLGLAIARELTQQLGGSLEVESVLGRGTTFSLVLPAKRSHEEITHA